MDRPRPYRSWENEQLEARQRHLEVLQNQRRIIAVLSCACGVLLAVCHHMARPQSASFPAEAACVLLLIGCLGRVAWGWQWRMLAAAVAGAAIIIYNWDAIYPAVPLLCAWGRVGSVWGLDHSKEIFIGFIIAEAVLECLAPPKVHRTFTRGSWWACLLTTPGQFGRLSYSCLVHSCNAAMVWEMAVASSQLGVWMVAAYALFFPKLAKAHEALTTPLAFICMTFGVVIPLLSWLYHGAVVHLVPYICIFMLPGIVTAATDLLQLLQAICMLLAKYDEALTFAASTMPFVTLWAVERYNRRTVGKACRCACFLLFPSLLIAYGTRLALMVLTTERGFLLTVHASWRLLATMGAVCRLEDITSNMFNSGALHMVCWVSAQLLLCAIWLSNLWELQCSVWDHVEVSWHV